MVDVIDKKSYCLYLDALSSSFYRSGLSNFESEYYAEAYMRKKKFN